jgi:hypothetical protein
MDCRATVAHRRRDPSNGEECVRLASSGARWSTRTDAAQLARTFWRQHAGARERPPIRRLVVSRVSYLIKSGSYDHLEAAMDLTFTHFRILFEALDSTNLTALTWRSQFDGVGGASVDWPPMPLDVVRAAALELVRAGWVYVVDDDGNRLADDAATSVLQDDRSWANPIAPGHYHEVAITDEGASAYEQLLPRFWPEGVNQDQ